MKRAVVVPRRVAPFVVSIVTLTLVVLGIGSLVVPAVLLIMASSNIQRFGYEYYRDDLLFSVMGTIGGILVCGVLIFLAAVNQVGRTWAWTPTRIALSLGGLGALAGPALGIAMLIENDWHARELVFSFAAGILTPILWTLAAQYGRPAVRRHFGLDSDVTAAGSER